MKQRFSLQNVARQGPVVRGFVREVIWPFVRPILGWLCLFLGVLGLVLPLLQGIPLLVMGIALVGRRHRRIRWVSVHVKLLLRRWAMSQPRLFGRLGQIALRGQQHISRQRRRLHWWWEERRRHRQQRESALLGCADDDGRVAHEDSFA